MNLRKCGEKKPLTFFLMQFPSDFTVSALSQLPEEAGVCELDRDDELGLALWGSTKGADGNASEVGLPAKLVRGVVVDTETGNPLFRPFPYTDDYIQNALPDDENSPDEYTWFYAYEGTLIRVFHWKDTWVVSTNRKLHASQSRWGTKESFLELFQSAWARVTESSFDDALQKDAAYMFLLTPVKGTRIVCEPTEDTPVLHVGTIRGGEWTRESLEGFSSPKACSNLREDMSTAFSAPNTYQGLIGFDYENHRQVKLVSQQYHELSKLRGNQPSMRFRYIQLRSEGEQKRLERFVQLYPEFSDLFARIERNIHNMAEELHRVYIKQNVYKDKSLRVGKQEHYIIRQCHAWHCADRPKNRVTKARILQEIWNLHPSVVLKLTKKFVENKTLILPSSEGSEGQPRIHPSANLPAWMTSGRHAAAPLSSRGLRAPSPPTIAGWIEHGRREVA